MISRRGTELLVGVFVTAGIAALFMLAMQVSNLSTVSMGDAYQVTARFTNIGSLNVRSPVKAGGVRVGRVSSINYDPDRFEAVVTLSIENRYDRFPRDTAASIFTAGLLGEQYIHLEPGVEEENLEQGDSLYITDSAIILERLIGRIITDKMME